MADTNQPCQKCAAQGRTQPCPACVNESNYVTLDYTPRYKSVSLSVRRALGDRDALN
jgi:hypothetical protein